MTIAISLKVNDGLVLAADSASTLIARDPSSGATGVVNVYNNANKIFNLRKGLPVGAITWGSGSIGNASISTLVKDLRKRFAGEDPKNDDDWKIQESSYMVEAVAKQFRRFMFEECYEPAFRDWQQKPQLGFIVAGYSPGEALAEEYQIKIDNGICDEPQLVRPKGDSGVTWSGEPEAISRLLLGFSPHLPTILQQLSMPSDRIEPIVTQLMQSLGMQLVVPAMPFQDAIDLAEFLVDLTIKFSRFAPVAQTVGGPIEIAAISKHEGFKWVRRKHYFSKDLNPQVGEAQ